MSGRRRIALGIAALCVLAALAPSAPAAVRPVPFQRGITLAEWGPTAYKPQAVERRLRLLHRRYGVDSVTLMVVWTQHDASSTVIRPGAQTVPTRNLVAAIRIARRLHMHVVLRPDLNLDNGVWRGQIQPSSPPAWFRSYRRFVLRYASIAQREHAAGFVIGSEMKSMSGYADDWTALAAAVRPRFHGFVTYLANWDENITWWSSLDAISLSAYYELAPGPHYSVGDLVADWAPFYTSIDDLRQAAGLPVIFGEIGYRSVVGSAMRPWDVDLRGRRSAEAQRIAYEAALRVWFRVPWFRGMQWWYVSAQDSLLDGRRGADHRPLAPALRTLGRWYHSRR